MTKHNYKTIDELLDAIKQHKNNNIKKSHIFIDSSSLNELTFGYSCTTCNEQWIINLENVYLDSDIRKDFVDSNKRMKMIGE